MVRLLLVRHGISEANLQNLIAGHFDTPLAAAGETQARALAKRLATERIDVAYSSDLLRTRRTAELALQNHKLSVKETPLLRERLWGIFEGQPVSQYLEAFQRSGLEVQQFKPEGGESLVELIARTKTFIEMLMKEHSGKTVFVAAHHSVNKAILTLLLKKQWSEWQSIIQHNACLNILSLSSLAEVKLELLGCVAHLPE